MGEDVALRVVEFRGSRERGRTEQWPSVGSPINNNEGGEEERRRKKGGQRSDSTAINEIFMRAVTRGPPSIILYEEGMKPPKGLWWGVLDLMRAKTAKIQG